MKGMSSGNQFLTFSEEKGFWNLELLHLDLSVIMVKFELGCDMKLEEITI